MLYDLFDYQRDAAVAVLENLTRGGGEWRSGRHLSSFALSAVTGSGKTVIAAAVIEAMLHGSADLDCEPDRRAAFLWVTDDPALIRQTRSKLMHASDGLDSRQVTILDNDFPDAELQPGRVYLLNTQKLSKNAGLAQGGVNSREHSMWDILANTVNGDRADLYLVLDEAHRGMRQPADRATIVHRLINGQKGSNPPAPVVWGISATIDRFLDAMGTAPNRAAYPPVEVDIDKVRASGLIKDEIGLDEPDEKGTFSTTLLRDAVTSVLDYDQRWDAYTADQNEQEVAPVLIVQVPDKVTDDALAEMVDVIEKQWPGLGPDAIVNVFGEHEPVFVGARTIRWVPPESIQDDTDIRVVFAKEAISTGWDCPRAEVLYSERPAKDATHIAQIIGRMVRQPLRHRIATDDALNTVACFLPRFDQNALSVVKAHLEGKGKAAGDTRLAASVVRAPQVFERNPAVPDGVFALIEGLPSVTSPDNLADPIRRAKQLVKLLTDDTTGKALLPDAGHRLTKTLNKRLDGLAAERSDDVDAKVDDIETLTVKRISLDALVGDEVGETIRESSTHAADIDRDTWKAVRAVKEGVGTEYLAHCLAAAGEGADRREVRTRVAALFLLDGVTGELQQAATKWVRDQLAKFAVEIANTTGATSDQFQRIAEQAPEPERVGVGLRSNIKTATKDGHGGPLPTLAGHIYAHPETHQFPVAHGSGWEPRVIETEIERPSFVAWYRNPSRPTPAALRIAYQDDADNWTSLQPDFVVVSEQDNGKLAASIIDPHGDHLADARAKLWALADYAEKYGDEFVRIESVAEAADKTLRVLDMKDPAVRAAVRAFKGAKVSALYESDDARPFI